MLGLTGADVTLIDSAGIIEGTEDYQLAAIEPVTGDLVAVGTDERSLYFFARTGGGLDYVSDINLGSGSVNTGAVEFQP